MTVSGPVCRRGAIHSFNMLKLPRYPSAEMLEEKLMMAIRHGNHQFTLT